MRLRPLALAAVGCGLALSGGAVAGAAPAQAPVPEPGPGTGNKVFIKTFIFRPKPLTVSRGTRVTFKNLDGTKHTVTSGKRGARTGLFNKTLGPNQTYSYKFTKKGRFAYFCKLHSGSGMTGVVVVK